MLECFEKKVNGRIFSDQTVKEYKSEYVREKPVIERCSCGFRKRGENHEQGEHHNKVSQSKRRRR